MKLATTANGTRDGALVIVSRDLSRAVSAGDIAATLQDALDRWSEVRPELQTRFDSLEAGSADVTFSFDPAAALAPLPRAWQWLDASAFESHVDLMQAALRLPPIPRTGR